LHDPWDAAASAVIGPARERAALDGFLDAVEDLPATLALEGPAGIGKTTVWREGVAMARAAGFRVLASNPAESERQLAYSGLSDLVADVALDSIDLPVPQRRALEVALLVEDADTEAPTGARRRPDCSSVACARSGLAGAVAVDLLPPRRGGVGTGHRRADPQSVASFHPDRRGTRLRG
jgi:hypothetical protein